MGQVIAIHQKRLFTLDEARELLPIVRRLTESTDRQVKLLNVRLNYSWNPDTKKSTTVEIQKAFQAWSKKLFHLGIETKGMWLADFDSGNGFYCWQYPEPDIVYFHSYESGMSGRVRIH